MRDVRPVRDLLLLAALGACGSTVEGTDAGPRDVAIDNTPADVAVDNEPVDVAPPPDKPPPASGIGTPCETDQMFAQGSCATGQKIGRAHV